MEGDPKSFADTEAAVQSILMKPVSPVSPTQGDPSVSDELIMGCLSLFSSRVKSGMREIAVSMMETRIDLLPLVEGYAEWLGGRKTLKDVHVVSDHGLFLLLFGKVCVPGRTG